MELPAGFALGAVLDREDPRDAFVSPRYGSLQELPHGAVVGTSSLRRAAQLLGLRPDLRIEPLRGNLDTRLRKLDEGGYDAIVLAAAGLKRLGLGARIAALFDTAQMTPAAGQGALGIEIREDAAELGRTLSELVHRPSWLAVHAERAVSRALGGSCSMPLAAHAVWEGEALRLDVALGHAQQLAQPLLRTQLRDRVASDADAAALGEPGRGPTARGRRRRLPCCRRLRRLRHARHRHPAAGPGRCPGGRVVRCRHRGRGAATDRHRAGRRRAAAARGLAPPGHLCAADVRQRQCGAALHAAATRIDRLAGAAAGRIHRAWHHGCAARGRCAARAAGRAGGRGLRLRSPVAAVAHTRLAGPACAGGARRRRPRLAGRTIARTRRDRRLRGRLPALPATAGRGCALPARWGAGAAAAAPVGHQQLRGSGPPGPAWRRRPTGGRPWPWRRTRASCRRCSSWASARCGWHRPTPRRWRPWRARAGRYNRPRRDRAYCPFRCRRQRGRFRRGAPKRRRPRAAWPLDCRRRRAADRAVRGGRDVCLEHAAARQGPGAAAGQAPGGQQRAGGRGADAGAAGAGQLARRRGQAGAAGRARGRGRASAHAAGRADPDDVSLTR